MFKKYFENKRKMRFENMARELKSLSDEELKSWYVQADTQRVIGTICKHERTLLHKIEDELNSRGFEYMEDY